MSTVCSTHYRHPIFNTLQTSDDRDFSNVSSAIHYNAATNCNTLPHTATHCSTLFTHCRHRMTLDVSTGWRRLMGCLKLQVLFRKRATNHRALLLKMTYKDKAPDDSTTPCIYTFIEVQRVVEYRGIQCILIIRYTLYSSML